MRIIQTGNKEANEMDPGRMSSNVMCYTISFIILQDGMSREHFLFPTDAAKDKVKQYPEKKKQK